MILRYDFDWGRQGSSTCSLLISSDFFMYWLMIWRSDWIATLLVMITRPMGLDLMKSTATSDLAFLRSLLILVTWNAEFLMNKLLLLLLMGTITYFLDGPFVVIWIRGLGFGLPLMMLLTWSSWFMFKARKDSLILSTLEVLAVCLEAWVYDLVSFIEFIMVLFPLKYFEIVLISVLDLAGSGEGGGGAFSIETETSLAISFLLLFLLGITLGVNLEDIFTLRVLVLLSIWRAFYLASYTNEIKFQMTLPMSLKSLRSLTPLLLTCLLVIYFVMKFKESLILFESEAKCLIKPWSEIGWKDLLQRSDSIGACGS